MHKILNSACKSYMEIYRLFGGNILLFFGPKKINYYNSLIKIVSFYLVLLKTTRLMICYYILSNIIIDIIILVL